MARRVRVKTDQVGAGVGKRRRQRIHRAAPSSARQSARPRRPAVTACGLSAWHHGAERQVGHIAMVVHHVEMDPVHACGNDAFSPFTEAGKVGRQDGGGYGRWCLMGNCRGFASMAGGPAEPIAPHAQVPVQGGSRARSTSPGTIGSRTRTCTVLLLPTPSPSPTLASAGPAGVAPLDHQQRAGPESEGSQGLGVVGNQPLLRPGRAFQYTSGCRLRTATAPCMAAFCVAEDGERFEVDIPALRGSTPRAIRHGSCIERRPHRPGGPGPAAGRAGPVRRAGPAAPVADCAARLGARGPRFTRRRRPPCLFLLTRCRRASLHYSGCRPWWQTFTGTVDASTLLADFGFASRTAFLSELGERLRHKLLPGNARKHRMRRSCSGWPWPAP